mgnify:CR=1 FL=1
MALLYSFPMSMLEKSPTNLHASTPSLEPLDTFAQRHIGPSDADIAELNIPTGIPLVYELDANFKPVVPGGKYLDPEAAATASAAVANQGKK